VGILRSQQRHRGRSGASGKTGRTGYTTHPASAHWFVDDIDHPYTETKRFDWMRGYHVGGRSLLWGRQSYRLSDLDFEANGKEGVAVDWPIRYADLAPGTITRSVSRGSAVRRRDCRSSLMVSFCRPWR
jgi:choline dehydrogenase-like flavoprotein